MATYTDAPNVTVLPEAAYQPTTTEQDKSRKVITLIDTLLSTPTLPTGAAVAPQIQAVQTGETLATTGVAGTVAAAAPTVPSAPTAAVTAPGATQTVAGITTPTYGQYTAGQIAGQAPTMVGQAGTVTAPAVAAQETISTLPTEATVKGQLEKISTDVETSLAQGTALPAFMRGAAEAAKAAMQARGLGQSTMLAEALAEGLLTASIPIAQADAETYKQFIFQNLTNRQQAVITNANNSFQMDMSNLSNKQQESLQNLQTKQAFMLSDQAASNAAFNFNATSQNQVNEYYDGLTKQIEIQNSQRADVMNQFAVTESNKISAINAQNQVGVDKANADRTAVINQFNANLEDQRGRFNVENQRVIDQSNVQWRRTINTANTATTNAINQLNATNLLNLSNYSLSALWQQWRDEASWVNSAAESEYTRAHNAALAALSRSTSLDLKDEDQKSELYTMLGRFGIALLTKPKPGYMDEQ